jgi:hypothetical protein
LWIATAAQSEGLRVADGDAENPASARQVADRAVHLRRRAQHDEALELVLVVIEHAERGVARARQIAGLLEHPLKDRFQIEFGDDRAPDLQDAAKSAFVQHGGSGHSYVGRTNYGDALRRRADAERGPAAYRRSR